MSLGTPETSGRIGEGVDFGSAGQPPRMVEMRFSNKEANWLVGAQIGTTLMEGHW